MVNEEGTKPNNLLDVTNFDWSEDPLVGAEDRVCDYANDLYFQEREEKGMTPSGK